ncbi:MAG: hypothetical protein J0647_06895 [Campylobacteraceae bacterium]|nr:hypothetical protein [Campylobacteraceae bacterium]
MKHYFFTPKAKTMIPVVSFFVLFFIILGLLRYEEVKKSLEKDEDIFSYQIVNAYEQSTDATFKFFTHRGSSCMSSLAIKEALKEKSSMPIRKILQSSWNELQIENPYLDDMRFYDAEFLPLFSFENTPFNSKIIEEVLKGESYATFTMSEKTFTYNIFVPSICEGKFIGMVEFIIDADYFLDYMKRTLGIQTSLFVNIDIYGKKSEKLPMICNFQLLSSTLPVNLQSSDIFKDLSACSTDTLTFGERTFAAHIFYVINKEAENLARFVFLYEMTEHQKELIYWIKKTFIISFFFIILSVFVVNFGFNILTKKLNIANKKLQLSENNLRLINKNLEERVNIEIQNRLLKEEEAIEKERIMIHQDKLASMGEMIGNIAHQWRQPLTELGSLFIRLEVCFEQNILDNQELKNIIQKSEKLISHMSQTIDDFRNFFSTKDIIANYSINETFHKAFYLISAALKNHHIEVTLEEDEMLFVQGTQSELIQAILNILSNAKDVLIERHIKNPKIQVSIFKKNGKNIIKFKDNAGGITYEPITKIFEPYVTSKHASSGTGIGLYMTKNIIENNQKGTLVVYNEDDGAVFEIILT